MRARPRQRSSLWVAAVATSALAALSWPRLVHAYRPFDGTDADVARPGEFALELGPAHYYQERDQSYLITPGGVLNLGLKPRVEVVVDFRNFVMLGERQSGGPRDRLQDTDLMIKMLLQRGALQGAAGPSIAVEAGMLLPDTYPRSSLGAEADTIVSLASERWVVHFNELIAGDRAHRLQLLSSAILEVGRSWSVRPVLELFVSHVFNVGSEYSALFGAIWPMREDLVLDVAGRAARSDGAGVWEIRLGFTWSFQLWNGSEVDRH